MKSLDGIKESASQIVIGIALRTLIFPFPNEVSVVIFNNNEKGGNENKKQVYPFF